MVIPQLTHYAWHQYSYFIIFLSKYQDRVENQVISSILRLPVPQSAHILALDGDSRNMLDPLLQGDLAEDLFKFDAPFLSELLLQLRIGRGHDTLLHFLYQRAKAPTVRRLLSSIDGSATISGLKMTAGWSRSDTFPGPVFPGLWPSVIWN